MKNVASMTALAALAALAALGAACGSSFRPPTDRLAASEAAIRSAKELGAQNDPQAALHVKLADDQVATARSLMRDGEHRRADVVLQRAKSDAELAVVLTREKSAKTDAQRAREILDAQKGGR